jgi:nitrite reductase/ring-hydroxylating ferredoxin subunit
VFNVKGAFYALRNQCPHQLGPLCLGRVRGTLLPSKPGEYIWGREDEILVCPWHGWEFDITTGQAVFDPVRWRARRYPVTVETDDGEPWPEAESYPVSVEQGRVVVHL